MGLTLGTSSEKVNFKSGKRKFETSKSVCAQLGMQLFKKRADTSKKLVEKKSHAPYTLFFIIIADVEVVDLLLLPGESFISITSNVVKYFFHKAYSNSNITL